MTFIYLLIGLAVGFTAAWFILQARGRNEILLAEQTAEREALLRERAESDAAELKLERDRLAREHATLQAERAALVASMDALRQQSKADAAHHQQRFDEQMATLKEQF